MHSLVNESVNYRPALPVITGTWLKPHDVRISHAENWRAATVATVKLGALNNHRAGPDQHTCQYRELALSSNNLIKFNQELSASSTPLGEPRLEEVVELRGARRHVLLATTARARLIDTEKA